MSDSQPRKRRQYATASFIGHLVRRGVPLLILGGILATAYYYWQHLDQVPSQGATNPPLPGPIPVSVIQVQTETVPIRPRFLGQTEAAQSIEIRARVAGHLQERNFAEGTQVEKGQKLFVIDPRPFEVEVAQAQAALAGAEATLLKAQQQLKRLGPLTETGVSVVADLEEWQAQQRVALAQIQQQKAYIEAAQLQLHYATIESPIAGVIGKALKDAGSYVDAGANGLLAVVQQVDPIYVHFSVTEQEMLRNRRQVEAGQLAELEPSDIPLEITLADGSTYPHQGKINFVGVQVEVTTGTTVVRGEVPNPDGVLRPGQFIYVNLLGIHRINVIRIPQDAVLQSPMGAMVYVIDSQGIAQARPVVLGEWSGNSHWIIEEGLNAGDQVITDRLMMIRPGMPVMAMPPAEATAHAPAETQF